MLRWLLPILAVLTLLGSSVTAWAAAGFNGDAECCCPVKSKCKCHDHDGDRDTAPMLKRCGGEATWTAPAVVAAVAAEVPEVVCDVCVVTLPPVHVERLYESPASEPEKPPI